MHKNDGGIIESCLNELLNGALVSNRAKALQLQRGKLEALWHELQVGYDDQLIINKSPLLVEIIEVVLDELGENDFQTHTGYDLSEARLTISKIHSLAEAFGEGNLSKKDQT